MTNAIDIICVWGNWPLLFFSLLHSKGFRQHAASTLHSQKDATKLNFGRMGAASLHHDNIEENFMSHRIHDLAVPYTVIDVVIMDCFPSHACLLPWHYPPKKVFINGYIYTSYK